MVDDTVAFDACVLYGCVDAYLAESAYTKDSDAVHVNFGLKHEVVNRCAVIIGIYLAG